MQFVNEEDVLKQFVFRLLKIGIFRIKKMHPQYNIMPSNLYMYKIEQQYNM